jgi:hypothetical protein
LFAGSAAPGAIDELVRSHPRPARRRAG